MNIAATNSDHVAIVLYGSRGDIQPGVCLALELQERVARVTVVAPPNLVDFARAAGVRDVREIGLDTHTAWASDSAKEAARGKNPITRMRFALATVRAGFAAFDDAMADLFLDDDAPLADVGLIVVAPLCQARGVAAADRLAIPMAVLRYGPMSCNGVIGALPGLGDGWPPAVKRWSWHCVDRLTWWATGWSENGFRRRIGLARVRGPLPRRLDARRIVQIQAYDPAFLPELEIEWGPTKPIVGFLDLPVRDRTDGPMTDDLGQWLSEGDPPLFVTFGSMPLPDPDDVAAVVIAAAREAGFRRCLVSVGDRRGVDPMDPDVFFSGALDHAGVLPRCAAALHHGGAGTTAATLRAGLPTVVCAVTADQPFWGQRVVELGVGARTRLKQLDHHHALRALTVVADPSVRAAAVALSTRMIQPEKSVAAAADICVDILR